MLKIAIDIMGGDNSPKEPIRGIKSYIEENPKKNTFFYIVGDKKNALELIANSLPKEQYEIISTTQKVEMHDKPSKVLREKSDSSMLRCLKLLRDSKVDAVISAGNTGALLLSSSIMIKKISNIKKAILAPIIPNKFGNFILADVGANINLKPHHFIDMANLCEIYFKSTKNNSIPNVHLLNIGTEKNKGTAELIEAHELLLKKIKNFKGNIEPRDLMTTKLDIVLCDGFVGNVVLKLIEGLSHFLLNSLKTPSNDLKTDSNINTLKNMFDFEISTLLLGINGIVLKCHGSSKRNSFKNAILEARKINKSNLITKINTTFQT